MQSSRGIRLPTTIHQHIKYSRRSIASSSPSSKALPFFLNTYRNSVDENGNVLRMLMFGKPGAGKGTLSARLVKKYDILALSTGDMLRQHIAEKSEVGRQAEDIVAQGGLLPDELMLKVVTTKLDHLHNKHWILDGFPRTLGQGKLLQSHLQQQGTPLSLVINLDVADDVILSRISDRWVHLPSGRVYNMSYNRPKVEGYDDETGEPLIKRPDDNPEIFGRRLAQFYESTSPLLSYYASLASQNSYPPPPPTKLRPSYSHSVSTPALKLATLVGKTSDEMWPHLDRLVRDAFPSMKEKSESREERRRHSLSDALMADKVRISTGTDKQ